VLKDRYQRAKTIALLIAKKKPKYDKTILHHKLMNEDKTEEEDRLIKDRQRELVNIDVRVEFTTMKRQSSSSDEDSDKDGDEEMKDEDI